MSQTQESQDMKAAVRSLSSWAQLMANGDKRAVELHVETSIREPDHLRLIVAEVLRAASRAEHEAAGLDPTEVAMRLKALGGNVKDLVVPPAVGIWFCLAHNREATHVGEHGRSCDPKLGGIMLPCKVEFRPKEP